MPAAFAKWLPANDDYIEISDSIDRVQLLRKVLQYLPPEADARQDD
jgi:hypothetical protein